MTVNNYRKETLEYSKIKKTNSFEINMQKCQEEQNVDVVNKELIPDI